METSRRSSDRPSDSTPTAQAPVLGELPALVDGARSDGRSADVLLRSLQAVGEMAQVGWGTSDVVPDKSDPRFADSAWRENPAYRWLAQAYLVWAKSLQDLAAAAAPDWRSRMLGRLGVDIFTGALAPTNFLWGNPAALRRALETGGVSLLRGFRNLVRDWALNGGMPAQIRPGSFTVGKDLAATPGAVVHREELYELIQYTPTTATVSRCPLLLVPPPINKYYIADLAPGRSLVEYIVAQGVPLFLMAWRNPRRNHGDWCFDDYTTAQLSATDVALEVSGSDDLNVAGACAGGANAATAVALQAARGDERVRSLTLIVTMLDTGTPNLITAMATPAVLAALDQATRAKVVLDREAMARMFSWWRPQDLVFNYVVNNWLLGNDPPPFDIMAWANDATNMVARYNAEILHLAATNAGGTPGAMTALGTPVDFGRITVDSYLLFGLTDHLSPWRAAYLSSQLLGGTSELVMTSTGHVQSVVNPPGQVRGSYWTGAPTGRDPEAWRASAVEHRGSWWPHWLRWLKDRSGEEVPAPARLGSERHPAGDPAPGRYVFER